MVVGKSKFCHFLQSDAVDYTFAREGDRSVADRVIELLNDGYQAIFAHFPNPDYFGHSTGWMSQTYMDELTNTDRQVGRVLAELETLGLTEETLVIMTADHGGHDTSHGQDIPEDMQIPWIIAGGGVMPEASIEGEVNVADTAATVLWALGLPASDQGRPITEVFAPVIAG
jgi:phosphopentomutase